MRRPSVAPSAPRASRTLSRPSACSTCKRKRKAFFSPKMVASKSPLFGPNVSCPMPAVPLQRVLTGSTFVRFKTHLGRLTEAPKDRLKHTCSSQNVHVSTALSILSRPLQSCKARHTCSATHPPFCIIARRKSCAGLERWPHVLTTITRTTSGRQGLICVMRFGWRGTRWFGNTGRRT
jgi:hypothetical protein